MEKVIQITAGRGPAECCWVVVQVLKMMLEEAREIGLEVFVLNKISGDMNRTLVSATIQLEGEKETVNEYSKNWIGTIQWIGKSQFRKYHKRNNWFIGVNELDLTNEKLQFDAHQIKYEATRAGGPGGQHVNKVSTAIRATHIPSGLAVLASDNRSQLQNKKKAKERLINLLKTKQIEGQEEVIKTNWQNHNELERGNPVQVFKGNDFKFEKKKVGD
jgi:peptide chain release factor